MIVKVDLSENGLKANLFHCAGWLIGGYENALTDYGEDSEEGIEAKAWLLCLLRTLCHSPSRRFRNRLSANLRSETG